MKENSENRKLEKMHFHEGTKFQPQQAVDIGSFGHIVLVLEWKIEERGYEISICI